MDKQIEALKKIRLFLLDSIHDLSTEQLNEIPVGFNNNIVWHLGHLVWAQQGICYLRSGLKPAIEENYILPYKSGTKPERFIDDIEISRIKEQLITTPDIFKTDHENKLFVKYNSWTTRYGVELHNIQDAMEFIFYHEGLHAGYILSIKKLITKSAGV